MKRNMDSGSLLLLDCWECFLGVVWESLERVFDQVWKQSKMAGDQAEKGELNFDDVENGPMSEANRECRDIICCFIFFVNIVGMVFCTAWAYTHGDPSMIFRGTDKGSTATTNVVCGLDAAKDYPYLYFYYPLSMDKADRTCIKACPFFQDDGTLTTIEWLNGTAPVGTPGQVDKDGNLSPLNADVITYATTTQLDRVCVPLPVVLTQAFKGATDSMAQSLSESSLASMVEDIQNNWMWLLAGFGMSVVLTLVWMFSLRCIVGCIVWLSIFSLIGLFIGLGVLFLYNGGAFSGTAAESYAGYLGMPTFEGSQHYKTYGYVSFGIAGLLLIIMFCCCSRIRLAVAVCQVAGEFVLSVCRVVWVPIIQALIIVCFWAASLVVMVYLVSSATYVHNGTDVFTSIADYTEDKMVILYYFLFSVLWVNAFLQAMGIFVIACSCCMWYYSHGPGDELDSPILRSYKMIFRYHFGSLAFGAFILAVVQFLQVMVEVFKKQAEASGADQHPCFEHLINCLRCCLACVERIVKFLNKTAYIQIALRGKNFCMAAKDGFEIVWSNAMRYTIVSGVGEIIMFIGKLMIAAATTACFYCLITFVHSIRANILEPLYLLLIIFIISYAVGVVFMAVYSIAMDTILACFIVDEMQQGSKGGSRALHAPQKLLDIMDVEDEKKKQ